MKSNQIKSHSIATTMVILSIALVVVLVLVNFISAYAIFFQRTTKAVMEQMDELTSQIVYNYESYINSIVNTCNHVQLEASVIDLDKQSQRIELSNYYKTILKQRAEIANIEIFSNDDGICLASTNGSNVGQISDVANQKWYKDANSDSTIYWFLVSPSGVIDEYSMTVSRQIKYNNNKLATMKLKYSFDSFVEIANRSKLGEFGHITIIDSDYTIVYSSISSKYFQEETQHLKRIILGNEQIKYNGYNMSATIDTLTNTKWRICVFINTDENKKIQDGFIVSMFLVSTAVLLVGIFLLLVIVKKITDPLKQLERAMRKVEEMDYLEVEQVDIKSSKEVVSLARSFNAMMQRINQLVEKVIKEQGAQRKSELKALQNQINPHFLYNTMDSIMWLIEQNKNKEAAHMLDALAKLFRISISRGKFIVPVKDELEHVKNYLEIQSIRYSKVFDYEFDVDQEVYKYFTIKLLLQPIVENCISHGLRDKSQHGKIVIKAYALNNKLVFSVYDNGLGISQEKIEQLYTRFADPDLSDGVGLKNIYQRLLVTYGKEADVKIESQLDEYTLITLIQPLNDKEGGSYE